MEAIAKQPIDSIENMGLSTSDFIRMDEKRSSRFFRELGYLQDEVLSLATSTKNFPHADISEGDMCPVITVNAFSTSMLKRLFLLSAMVNGDEQGIPDLREVEQ